MKTLRVGLTGGLAAGKSTVADWLRQAGFLVVDADQLVADLYRPGAEGSRIIEKILGETFLNDRGAVDQPRVAARIFEDPEARRLLESQLHPLVRKAFETLAEGHDGILVLEATLLVEAGFAADFDWVVTVEADPELRIRRAVARGAEEGAARQRLQAQGNEETRRAAAHRVLWNNGTLADLRRQVDGLIRELQEMVDHEE